MRIVNPHSFLLDWEMIKTKDFKNLILLYFQDLRAFANLCYVSFFVDENLCCFPAGIVETKDSSSGPARPRSFCPKSEYATLLRIKTGTTNPEIEGSKFTVAINNRRSFARQIGTTETTVHRRRSVGPLPGAYARTPARTQPLRKRPRAPSAPARHLGDALVLPRPPEPGERARPCARARPTVAPDRYSRSSASTPP